MGSFLLGMILGAFLLGSIGNTNMDYAFYTLLAIAVSSFFNILFMLFNLFFICRKILAAIIATFVFKENTKFYQERHQRKFTLASINPFLAVRSIFGKSTYVTCLALIYGFTFVGVSDTMNTTVLYLFS